jgi:hypothetical protein
MRLRAITAIWVIAVLVGAAFNSSPEAYTEGQQLRQPAARNREASTFTPVLCNSAGENGRTYYRYHYVNRLEGTPTYRVIIPPDWSYSIGGRDWSDPDLVLEVIARGCHSH